MKPSARLIIMLAVLVTASLIMGYIGFNALFTDKICHCVKTEYAKECPEEKECEIVDQWVNMNGTFRHISGYSYCIEEKCERHMKQS